MGFELLGFDFMIDTSLRVQLIEVNENPCLSTLSEKQGMLIGSLVRDTLALTVDSVFNLPENSPPRFRPDDAYQTRFNLIYASVDGS